MTTVAVLGHDVAVVLVLGLAVLAVQSAIYWLLRYTRPNIRFHKLRNDRNGDIVFLIRNLDAVRYRDELHVALEPVAAIARVCVHAGPYCPDPPAVDATGKRIAIAFAKVPADATFSIQVQRKDLGKTVKLFLDPSSPLVPRKFDAPLPPMAGIRRLAYFGLRFTVGLAGFVVLFCAGARLQGWELQAVDWAFIAAGLPIALAVFTLVVPTGGKPLVAGYLGWRGASRDWPPIEPATTASALVAAAATEAAVLASAREVRAEGSGDLAALAVRSGPVLPVTVPKPRAEILRDLAALAARSEPVMPVVVAELRAESSGDVAAIVARSKPATPVAIPELCLGASTDLAAIAVRPVVATVALPAAPAVDVLIVVALAEEHNPFRRYLELAHRAEPLDHWTALLPTGTGERRRVALVVQKEMGGIEAAALTSRAVALLRPRMVVMSGILGGFKAQEVALGDIVIAGLAVDYAVGKVASGARGPHGAETEATQRRLSIQKLGAPLAANVQAWLTNDQDDRRCSRFLSEIRPELLQVVPVSDRFGARIHCGPIASGPLVVASDRFVEMLQTIDYKLLGVEMEIHAVMHAGHAAGLPVIGIKAVSDLADGDKSSPRGVDGSAARTFAAHASARLCVQLIRDGVI